ncbi:hypothetical protein BHE74_00021654 [Ensete ventricosum]|nr:hypothetical protein BHE74_00021654 [Ensete ventricosum]
MKLQPDVGPRSSLGIGPGSDDAVGSRRSSLGDSPKRSGSYWEHARRSSEEDQKTCCKNARGCQIGGSKSPVSGGCPAVAQAFGQLTHLGRVVEPPVPRCSGS